MGEDIEKVIVDNVWTTLKNKVKGKVFVRLYQGKFHEPYLLVKVCMGSNIYTQTFEDIYNSLYNGNMSTDDIVDLFLSGYKHRLHDNLNRRYFK